MRIGLIAANGKLGKEILREAYYRQHDVTAIVLNKGLVKYDVPIIEADLFHLTKDQLEQFDVIINAFAPTDNNHVLHLEAGKHLISLLEGTNTRLFIVGHSGCLYIDEQQTIRLHESEEFPEHLATAAKYHLELIEQLKENDMEWTFLAPSALFDVDGPRTGHYITGDENITFNSQYNSYISYSDFAVATIDEIENSNFVNTFYTVASENTTSAS
mgnify:FL=1